MLMALVLFALVAVPLAQAAPYEEERWGKHIQAFEERDKTEPPPENAVLFIGSSSIVGWDVKKWFPEYETINRGFGGSCISDSVYFADRIVIPYKPRAIVFYAGDNDIAGGKTPETVAKDFKTFVEKVRKPLPEVRLIFVAIKPCKSRWHVVDKVREANTLIKAYIETADDLEYVDIDTPTIGGDGEPRDELFKKDNLHLNEKGYAVWTALVKPLLGPPDREKEAEK